jgi:hypothetical protein
MMASEQTKAVSIEDIDRALFDPGSVFESPESVLTHKGLSKQQRIDILRLWEYDVSETCVATEEGMPDGQGDLLNRIIVALGRLAEIDLDKVGPTKQHGIPRSAVKPKLP